MYLQIIQLFNTARLWECAIPLCKELADLYEKRTYDYVKLADLLRQQADFYSKILNDFRPEPEYFMVGYYGLAFPCFVRNKEFIYRGLEFEKIGEFTSRLAKEFPAAKVLGRLPESVAKLKEEEGANILILSVKPTQKDAGTYFGPEVPANVKKFYAVNQVSSFLFDKPYHKGTIFYFIYLISGLMIRFNLWILRLKPDPVFFSRIDLSPDFFPLDSM